MFDSLSKKLTPYSKFALCKELVANGDEALEPYIFDYLLLCNKICGASHYNMQMKIIVETPEEYQAWIDQQQTFAQVIQ